MTDHETITVRRPRVPYGPEHKSADEADVDYLRSAVTNIRHARCMGSNLTNTVCDLLNDAADRIEAQSGALHRIVWTHDRDTVRPKVICTGPEGSTCRLTCADPTCADEEFNGFHRDKDGNPFHTSGEDDDGNEIVHPMKDGGFCNVCEFLNEGGCIDEEAVDTEPFVIGIVPIEPVWEGDHYEWKRAGGEGS